MVGLEKVRERKRDYEIKELAVFLVLLSTARERRKSDNE